MSKKDQIIAELREENTLLKKQIIVLMHRIAELERRLGLNSNTSSKPPSSDGLCKEHKRPPISSKESSKPKGGEHGHRGRTIDYIWIRVNDNTVYVGPDGGDRIERKTVQSWFGEITQVTNGHRTESCERGTDWSYTGYIDIKNHLKQGENTIWMRVIVSGSGEGWMKIKARQRCCTKLYLPTSRI